MTTPVGSTNGVTFDFLYNLHSLESIVIQDNWLLYVVTHPEGLNKYRALSEW